MFSYLFVWINWNYYSVCFIHVANTGSAIFIQNQIVISHNLSSLWNNLSLQIYNVVSKRVGFNFMNILFGKVPLSKSNQIINVLILYVKQYIFQWIYYKKTPVFQGLLYHLSLKDVKFKSVCQLETLQRINLLYNWKNEKSF